MASQLDAAPRTCDTAKRRCKAVYGLERPVKEASQEVLQALAVRMSGGHQRLAKVQQPGLKCLRHDNLLVSVSIAEQQPLFA